MMTPNVSNTHVRTGVVQLGSAHLYEPHAFKPAGDAKQDAGDQPAAKYDLVLAFDKKTQKADIKAANEAQKAAVQRMIDNGQWDDQMGGLLAFKDADKSKVARSMTDKTKVLLAEKRPELKGKWSLKLTARATRRPDVRYVDADGIIRQLPDPILDPKPGQEAEAERVRQLWDSLVFPGQNAVVGYTFRGWTLNTGGQGTSASIDNILILGGGKPQGMVPFEADFDKDTLGDIEEWVAQNVRHEEPGAEPDVDGDTGEIASPVPDDSDVDVEELEVPTF